MIRSDKSQPKIARPCTYRPAGSGGALLSGRGRVRLRLFLLVRSPVLLELAGAPPVLQDVAMEPQPGSPPSPSSPGTPTFGRASNAMFVAPSGGMAAPDEPKEEVATTLEPDRRSTSSSSSSSSSSSAGGPSHTDVVELGKPLVVEPEVEQAAPAESAEIKPEGWAAWPPEQPPGGPPPQTAGEPEPLPSEEGGAATTGLTQAPEVQTMTKPEDAGAKTAGTSGYDPERIPASIFHPRTSSAQADWSVASNESLFSIHGASHSVDLGGFYTGSRSHFDYFYDEAMAAAGGAEGDSKLPPLAEGLESGMPGSAGSEASAGGKNGAGLGRHENGSVGSSSNFSFAFPILAETSPKKKDAIVAGALYRPPPPQEYEQLPQPVPPPQEYEQLPQPVPPRSAFEEMTTEEERRSSTGWWCCGECCGCCWFACSWRTCCCCCQWRWWSCSCPCPGFFRCKWCPCS